ncbi:hypothetical protein WG906_19305, partial [Pedobacter sp. P351]|uniref:hypothetical protein n=1 Tax=Pedobacter superstes TaxID=3133441 RepID=UPI00309516FE
TADLKGCWRFNGVVFGTLSENNLSQRDTILKIKEESNRSASAGPNRTAAEHRCVLEFLFLLFQDKRNRPARP